MNKFAKYVPEEDKKKQREHIGAMGLADMPFGETYIPVDANIAYDGTRRARVDGVSRDMCQAYLVTLNSGTFLNPEKTYAIEVNDKIIGVSDGFRIHAGYGDTLYTGNGYWLEYMDEYDNGLPFSLGTYLSGPDSKPMFENDSWGINLDVALFPEGENLKVRLLEYEVKTIDPKYLPEGVGSSIMMVTITADESGSFALSDGVTVKQLYNHIQSGGYAFVNYNGGIFQPTVCYIQAYSENETYRSMRFVYSWGNGFQEIFHISDRVEQDNTDHIAYVKQPVPSLVLFVDGSVKYVSFTSDGQVKIEDYPDF